MAETLDPPGSTNLLLQSSYTRCLRLYDLKKKLLHSQLSQTTTTTTTTTTTKTNESTKDNYSEEKENVEGIERSNQQQQKQHRSWNQLDSNSTDTADWLNNETLYKNKYLALTQIKTVEDQAKELLQEWKRVNEQKKLTSTATGTTEAADMTELAPKKANLDLKRDLQKRLKKVEHQMQAAIVELIHRRVRGSSSMEVTKDSTSKEKINKTEEHPLSLAEAVDSLYAQHQASLYSKSKPSEWEAS